MLNLKEDSKKKNLRVKEKAEARTVNVIRSYGLRSKEKTLDSYAILKLLFCNKS